MSSLIQHSQNDETSGGGVEYKEAACRVNELGQAFSSTGLHKLAPVYFVFPMIVQPVGVHMCKCAQRGLRKEGIKGCRGHKGVLPQDKHRMRACKGLPDREPRGVQRFLRSQGACPSPCLMCLCNC